MAKAQDINTVMKDIMGAFPVDTKAMEDAFKNQAALNEKLSGVALTLLSNRPKSRTNGPKKPWPN